MVLETLLDERCIEVAVRLVKPSGVVAYMNNEPPDMPELSENNIKFEFIHHRPDGTMLAELAALFGEGVLKMPEIDVLPLDKAAEAQKLSESGRTRGKIVLHVQDI